MPFLDEVVLEVRRSVAEATYGSGLSAPPAHRPPSFRHAIERDRANGAVVVEFKRVSPGQPDPVLPARTIAEFVELTRLGPVAGYSCLATTPRFRGSPRDVAELARSTDRPVLFKDIVVDRRQVEVAARTGASAILLIARLAGHPDGVEPLASLAEEAHRRGLEVLLEFHDRTELSRGADVAADVYGVNARDLGTLAIDRVTAAATLREARALGLHPLLGLSGVERASDARQFWNSGVDGILVGTAVARAAQPGSFLASLRRDDPGGIE
jgi:indole-3-glycerol phosphate synthase